MLYPMRFLPKDESHCAFVAPGWLYGGVYLLSIALNGATTDKISAAMAYGRFIKGTKRRRLVADLNWRIRGGFPAAYLSTGNICPSPTP